MRSTEDKSHAMSFHCTFPRSPRLAVETENGAKRLKGGIRERVALTASHVPNDVMVLRSAYRAAQLAYGLLGMSVAMLKKERERGINVRRKSTTFESTLRGRWASVGLGSVSVVLFPSFHFPSFSSFLAPVFRQFNSYQSFAEKWKEVAFSHSGSVPLGPFLLCSLAPVFPLHSNSN